LKLLSTKNAHVFELFVVSLTISEKVLDLIKILDEPEKSVVVKG
jgi:hypothetical protein